MNDYDILSKAGMDPAPFERNASCDELGDEPGILTGRYNRRPCIARWTTDADGAVANAWALVGNSYEDVYGTLSTRERERLRGENLIPSGMDKPVGQEVAAAAAQGVPYTPPLPAIDATGDPALDSSAVEEDDTELSDVSVEPAPCGNPDCIVFNGPEGRKEVHVEGCPA